MTWLRLIWADLVEKRLWPIALLLAVGAVALPVGARLTETQPSSAAVAVSPAAASPAPIGRSASSFGLTPAIWALVAQSALTAGVPGRPVGRLHNPFLAGGGQATAVGSLGAPPTGTGSEASTAASATGGSGSPSSAGSPPSLGGSPSGLGSVLGAIKPVSPSSIVKPAGTPNRVVPPSKPAGTAPAGSPQNVAPSAPPVAPSAPPVAPSAPPTTVYEVALRFGAVGSLSTLTDPVRLKPLWVSTAPAVVFLGVMSGAKTAAFLLPAGSTATGQGSCRLSLESCQVLNLAPGNVVRITVPRLDAGPPVTYQLHLLAIRTRQADSSAAAVAAHERESSAGRAILAKSSAPALAELNFSPRSGTVFVRSAQPLPPALALGAPRQAPRMVVPPLASPPAPVAPALPPTAGMRAGNGPTR